MLPTATSWCKVANSLRLAPQVSSSARCPTTRRTRPGREKYLAHSSSRFPHPTSLASGSTAGRAHTFLGQDKRSARRVTYRNSWPRDRRKRGRARLQEAADRGLTAVRGLLSRAVARRERDVPLRSPTPKPLTSANEEMRPEYQYPGRTSCSRSAERESGLCDLGEVLAPCKTGRWPGSEEQTLTGRNRCSVTWRPKSRVGSPWGEPPAWTREFATGPLTCMEYKNRRSLAGRTGRRRTLRRGADRAVHWKTAGPGHYDANRTSGTIVAQAVSTVDTCFLGHHEHSTPLPTLRCNGRDRPGAHRLREFRLASGRARSVVRRTGHIVAVAVGHRLRPGGVLGDHPAGHTSADHASARRQHAAARLWALPADVAVHHAR